MRFQTFGQIWKNSILKPILIITVDGGPDENPRYEKTINCAIDLFRSYNLDALFLATNFTTRFSTQVLHCLCTPRIQRKEISESEQQTISALLTSFKELITTRINSINSKHDNNSNRGIFNSSNGATLVLAASRFYIYIYIYIYPQMVFSL